MEWLRVESSALSAISYQPERLSLYVRLHSGQVCRYFLVYQGEYDSVMDWELLRAYAEVRNQLA